MSSRVLSLAVGGLWVASFFRIAFLVEKAATQSMFDSCEIGTLRALGLVCSWSLLNMIGLRSSEACLVGRVFSALSWLSDLRFGNGLGFVCSWLLIALLISWVRSDMGGLSWGFYELIVFVGVSGSCVKCLLMLIIFSVWDLCCSWEGEDEAS